jgi:hypothetical protein
MKKILGIVVLGLLFGSTCFAKPTINIKLALTGPAKTLTYNYNSYAKESSWFKIEKYCDQTTPTSLMMFKKMANCWYDEEIRLLKKYDLLYGDFSDPVFSTYKRYYDAAEDFSINLSRGNDTVDSYSKSMDRLMHVFGTRQSEYVLNVILKLNDI